MKYKFRLVPSYRILDSNSKQIPYMKKWIFLIAWLPFCGLSAQEPAENETGIQFFEGTYAEALNAAKEANRLLFIDCYTQWCGPCKQMAKTTFKDAQVAEFFNESFVNLQLDMESPDGLAQKDKLGVNAYPTLVFVDPATEEVIHKIVGSSTPQEFLKSTVTGLSGNNIKTMTDRYNAGERSDEFIAEYIDVLSEANDKEILPDLAAQYLEDKSEQMLTDAKLFRLFMSYCNSPYDKPYLFFRDNRDKFVQQYGEMQVNMKEKYMWILYGRKFTVKGEDGTYTFDEKGWTDYMKYMQANGIKEAKKIEIFTRMYFAECTEDWAKYIAYGDKMIKKYNAESNDVYNWAARINKLCDNAKLRNHAAIWCDNYAATLAEQEAQRAAKSQGGRTMAMQIGPQSSSFAQLALDLRNEKK